jgi:hypothetical protein
MGAKRQSGSPAKEKAAKKQRAAPSQKKPAAASSHEHGDNFAPDKNDNNLQVVLKGFMKNMTRDEHQQLQSRLASMGGVLTVGSACSGSEVAKVALQELGQTLGFKVVTKFSCEKDWCVSFASH